MVIEVKSLSKLPDVAMAQVLSYLRLADKRLGLLINFNVARVVDGIERIVNRFGRDNTVALPQDREG